MTIKQQIKHEAIQKVCHLHNAFFTPNSEDFTQSFPLCYSLKRGEREFFAYLAVPAYRVKIPSLDTIEFLDPHCKYKQPH